MVSGEEQRDSATHIHVFILAQTPLLSRLLRNIEFHVLCVRILLVILFIYSSMHMSIPNSVLPPHPSPWESISSFSKSVSLFLFCKLVYLYCFFLDSPYKGYHILFLLLCLTSLSMTISRSIQVATNGIIPSFLMAD